MKREGRQHGMVRYSEIWPSQLRQRTTSRVINQFDSPPTNSYSTKVLSRPTNHSKFTGKCHRREHPICKSKDKAKGSYKMYSHDMVLNYRLASCSAKGNGGVLHFSGVSASGLLNYLVTDSVDYEVDDQQVIDDELFDSNDALGNHSSFPHEAAAAAVEEEEEEEEEEQQLDLAQSVGNEGDDSIDISSFFDVGFVLDQMYSDGDWCIVWEI